MVLYELIFYEIWTHFRTVHYEILGAEELCTIQQSATEEWGVDSGKLGANVLKLIILSLRITSTGL
jgi:hypothetical protein